MRVSLSPYPRYDNKYIYNKYKFNLPHFNH